MEELIAELRNENAFIKALLLEMQKNQLEIIARMNVMQEDIEEIVDAIDYDEDEEDEGPVQEEEDQPLQEEEDQPLQEEEDQPLIEETQPFVQQDEPLQEEEVSLPEKVAYEAPQPEAEIKALEDENEYTYASDYDEDYTYASSSDEENVRA